MTDAVRHEVSEGGNPPNAVTEPANASRLRA